MKKMEKEKTTDVHIGQSAFRCGQHHFIISQVKK